MKQKLVVMSADGLVKEDVDYMMTLPGYAKYLRHAARAERVRSIYPTITYPCHTTMCTGVFPDRHGVTGNLLFQPGQKNIPWKWFRKYNLCPNDLFRSAKQNGLSTGAVFWPVTGRHPDIDYLIAEYWPQSESETAHHAFADSGSSPEVLDIIDRFAAGVKIRQHPCTDDFMVHCAAELIRRFSPDLLMIHPGNVDGYRHGHGVFNEFVTKGVEETDRYISEIMEAIEDSGHEDSCNFVLTSDHGLIDVKRIVNVNAILKKNGLIRTDSDGKLTDWTAYCQSGGTSAMIYLKHPEDRKLFSSVHSLLMELCSSSDYGIGGVMTHEETEKRYHLDGPFSFVLETDGITAFGDSVSDREMMEYDVTDYRSGHATHGHMPEKGPQPVFIGTGPAFRKDTVIPNARLVDEAPTFAKILGIDLPDADGVPIESLLTEPDNGGK